MELANGIEPSTCWLQISCSACWATPACGSRLKTAVRRRKNENEVQMHWWNMGASNHPSPTRVNRRFAVKLIFLNLGWAENLTHTYLTLPFVGKRASHDRLSRSQDRHPFQWLRANSCDKLNRFSFGTFFLAGFRDCSLLELHLLVLSHISPCELDVCSYFRTISRFWLCRRVHFCFTVK